LILLALALLGFGVGDLLRWSPERVSARRTGIAVAGATGAVAAVAALCGMRATSVVAAGAVALPVLAVWLAFDRPPLKDAKPEYALALIILTLVVLFAASGSAAPIGGPVASWYSNLDFPFARSVSVDRFVLGVGAALFLLATTNRIVRLVLDATETSTGTGEGALRGGRLLGPMERLIIAATVLSGDLAGAGFVIAAKGLLRFPEIRRTDRPQTKVDEITEYFLIGTFTSVVAAATVAVLVLAAS